MQKSCTQCAECCRKGGPTLHIEDKFLIVQNKIPVQNLFTLRKKEFALEPIEGRKIMLEEEIIKIKPDPERNWACLYLTSDNSCSIYSSRPVECRLLKCWDTRALLAKYQEDRLSRKDIFSSIQALHDLIDDHEKRCSYEKVHELAQDFEDKDKLRELGEMILYDMHIREVVLEKKPEIKALENLVFGRPLIETISLMFEVKIEKKDSKWIIKPKNIRV